MGGSRSDLTAALRGVREKMQGKPVQAIVLFSDGRQNGYTGDLTQTLSTITAPVFTVACAGPVYRDVAITRLAAPASAFVGQAATIRADVRGIGFHDKPIDVTLTADGAQQSQSIALPDDRSATAEFAIRFDRPGKQRITISVAPQPGEVTANNNLVSKQIEVVAEKVKVLAATGWPGWEYQYLHDALAASSFVELKSQVLLDPTAKLTATPDQILQQDVILLSDVRADSLSLEQSSAIERVVNERGGSVIIVPGDPKNLVELAAKPGIKSLLPFSNVQDAAWRVWPGEEPYFLLDVAPGAEDSDAVRLADDPRTSARRWSELGGMFRFMPVTEPRPEVRDLLIEPDSQLPMLTEMRVGAGRAFFFGARETWRWRYSVGGRDQDRFWLQLMRYAARSRAGGGDMEITQDPLAELANVAGDEQRLRRIANASGGEMLRIDEVADLPARIRSMGEKLPGFFEYPIWDSGYLFSFVIGCFGVEWALRKRLGLV